MRKYRNVTTIRENHLLFGIWKKMMERCGDPSCERYADYGGRGISVCYEWENDFDAFADWSHENGFAEGLTIDRIDNDGNYEPNNCRWMTRREQNRNKRTNKLVTYKGITKPLVEWCEELGLRYDPIHNRLEKGWTVEDAFEKPFANSHKSLSQMCREHGIKLGVVVDRVNKLGWDLDKALNTPPMQRGENSLLTGDRIEHIECEQCGTTFVKRQGGQKYCSEVCREAAKKIRRRKADSMRGYATA